MAYVQREYQKFATRFDFDLAAGTDMFLFDLVADPSDGLVGGKSKVYRYYGCMDVLVRSRVAGTGGMWYIGIRKVPKLALNPTIIYPGPTNLLAWDDSKADEPWLHWECHSFVPYGTVLVEPAADLFWSFPFSWQLGSSKWGINITNDDSIVLVAGIHQGQLNLSQLRLGFTLVGVYS